MSNRYLERTDERSDEEKCIDAILFLLLIIGGPWIVLGLILAVLSWLT